MTLTRFIRDPAGSDAALNLSLTIAGLGTLVYAFLAFVVGPFASREAFGTDIYDLYYLAILDGRFDLPARILRYEGHYAPDGTGYLYHGLAPLLTRFAVGWVWPLPQVSQAYASIWFWAVAGTACYHLTFATIARHIWNGPGRRRTLWAALLAFGVWFTTPGLLLSAAPSLFHETSSVAYAMAGGFVLLWTRAALSDRLWSWALVGLALCAGIALHARPNVAVGLYLGAVLAIGLALWNDHRRAVLPMAFAIAILGVAGMGYLKFNEIRFGSATQVHGSYDQSSVQYGPVFWGYEEQDSARAAAFVEHGRFNLRRVLPNLALYIFDLPDRSFLIGPSAVVEAAYRKATANLGFIRLEGPRMGMAWIFAGCLVLAAAAPFARQVPPRMAGLLIATGAAAGLTLAYGTVTLRYRFDVWPFVASAGAIGLYAVVPRLVRSSGISPLKAVLTTATIGSTLMIGLTTFAYRDNFRTIYEPEVKDTFFAPWSQEECLEKGSHLDLSRARLMAICTLPQREE